MDERKKWIENMCVYQIWCRSFCDSNGDGVGDLGGVLLKLDYIKSLGVDAIWFSPLYPSPNKDYGYDIADYRDISPEYGTLKQFKEVLDGAHERGMKVIMDLVVNHTSDQHKWFLESKKGGENNPYADYYIWRKGRVKHGKQLPPNNWMSTFPGEGWKYVAERGEWYLHLFAVEQPDLNHDNPKVRQEVKDVMRFWLDMGVDGFREDVITFISKREGLPNGFPIPAARGMEHYKNGPNIHRYLSEYRKVLDEYGAFTVGEAPMMTPKCALTYIGGENKQLDAMFGFQHMEADCLFISWMRRPFNLKKLKKVYKNWQTKLYGRALNANYIENHDQPRVISRYGSERYRAESGKALATMYLMLNGAAFVYQGQEIGMINNPNLQSWDDFVDVNTFACRELLTKLHFSDERVLRLAKYAARDNARTPVPWSGEANGGFTSGSPWYALNPTYPEINVKSALEDNSSVLFHYRHLMEIRKKHAAATNGEYIPMLLKDKQLFVYEKRTDTERLLIVLNLSEKERVLPRLKNVGEKATLLLSGYETEKGVQNTEISLNNLALRPYEALVMTLK